MRPATSPSVLGRPLVSGRRSTAMQSRGARLSSQNRIERQVGGQAAIDKGTAIDFDRGKSGQQHAGANMIGLYALMPCIEYDFFAGFDVNGERCIANASRLEQIEVDQPFQRLSQRSTFIKRWRSRADMRPPPGSKWAERRKYARAADRHRPHDGHGAMHGFGHPAQRGRARPCPSGLPKRAKPIQSVFAAIAGNDGPGDRADRSTDNPVRLDPALMQRLLDPGMIGTQCVATAEDERNLIVRHGAWLSQLPAARAVFGRDRRTGPVLLKGDRSRRYVCFFPCSFRTLAIGLMLLVRQCACRWQSTTARIVVVIIFIAAAGSPGTRATANDSARAWLGPSATIVIGLRREGRFRDIRVPDRFVAIIDRGRE